MLVIGDKIIVVPTEGGKNAVIPIISAGVGDKTVLLPTTIKNIPIVLGEISVGDKVICMPDSTEKYIVIKGGEKTGRWSGRYNHSTVVLLNGKIVLMGGRNSSGTYFGDIWISSNDGAIWVQQSATAGWTARMGHASVVMPDGSIILVGGYTGGSYKNDSWRSTDEGKTWVQQSATAGWTARWGHSCVVIGTTIYLNCGYDDIFHSGEWGCNDMWKSDDNGVTWTEVFTLDSSPNRRWLHSAFAMPDNSIIISDGYNMGGPGVFDCWRSTDNGIHWTQQAAWNGWNPDRVSRDIACGNDLVIMGGIQFYSLPWGFYHDIRISTDNGVTWAAQSAAAGWSERGWFSCVYKSGKIILFGGYDISLTDKNDVWQSTDKGITWTCTLVSEH